MERTGGPFGDLLLVLAFGAAGGCDSRGSKDSVVVYSSADEHYAKPVLREFARRTGIEVLDLYDTEASKTTGLYIRLLQEKDRPRADVFWNSEVLRTVLLAEKGLLVPWRPPSAEEIPAAYRDPGDRWTGFAARARVIIYNTTLVSAADRPLSIADLAAPRWKDKAAIAIPLFGTTATHAGALRAALGKAAMEDLFRRYKANGVRAVQGNSVVRDLVVSGELALGLTDTDDAWEAMRAGKPVTMVFPDQGEPFPGLGRPLGAFLIPSTVGLVAGGPHPEAARRLVEFLLSPDAEEMLARSGGAQVPLRPGLPPPPGLPLPADLKRMEVDLTAAARGLDEEERFLQDLFAR